MASTPNVYTAEPAYPVLADTLLIPQSRILDKEPPINNNDWDLEEDWDAGIRPHGTGIFRFGAVIGFSRLRTRSKETDEYIGQVGAFSLPSCIWCVLKKKKKKTSDPPSPSNKTPSNTISIV